MSSCRAAGFLFTLLAGMIGSTAAADVRERAVLSVTFDEAASSDAQTAADSSSAGKVADAISLTGSPARIPSAFVPGGSGSSLILDPARRQQLVIATSEDVSRPEAVTISGLFASLHPLSDKSYLGLFAKRKGGQGDNSNYGINFRPEGDVFQVYVNDGTGYKVANFSVKGTLGFRRRVHLTLAMDTGDAPGADADADADDTRVRLFINGSAVAPTTVNGGFAEAAVAWFPDVTLAKCTSDTPLTIGSSFVDGELMRLIVDDVHLFAEALSDEDVRSLFTSVTGTAAEGITAELTATAAAGKQAPQLSRVEPHALRIGTTQRVVLIGIVSGISSLHAGVDGITAAHVADGSNSERAVFDVTVDASVVPGRYLVRCVTRDGVSNPVIIAVDGIGSDTDGKFTQVAPAESLPVAVSGLISGTEQKRLWFRGMAGQRVVAEAEARRIGSKLDPVVEIHAASGAPLAIQWQQSELSGDARASTVLPADGLYYAEIHDLQFQAPGGSAWRLIVGDLPPSAIAFPSTVSLTPTAVRLLGGGAVSESVSIRAAEGRTLLDGSAPLLPLPPLEFVSAREVVEPMDATFAPDPVDATFTTAPFPPLALTGRIAAAKEADTIVLTVSPGQSLHVSAAARRLRSSLRPKLSVFNGDALLVANDGESGAVDPAFAITVPDGVTQLKLRIEDLTGKGSPSSVYRIEVARADRTAFLLSTDETSLQLPANGSVPIRLNVTRQSPSFRYTGPIHLSVAGAPGVAIVPDVIPPSDQNQQVFVMLTRSQEIAELDLSAGQAVEIIGAAEGSDPPFRISVAAPTGSATALTIAESSLLTGAAASVPATLSLDAAPPILFRGIASELPVRVIPLADPAPAFVRFELLSTEPDRKDDPNKPDSPLKPKVRLDELAFASVSQDAIPLRLHVPFDTPSESLDAVLSAVFVSQPLAVSETAPAWSAPMTLVVADAVTIPAPAEPFKGAKSATVTLTGSIVRHPLFTDAVSVQLQGQPEGFVVTPAMIAAGESQFSLNVTVPDSAAGEIPNLMLTCTATDGSTIAKPAAVRLVIE